MQMGGLLDSLELIWQGLASRVAGIEEAGAFVTTAGGGAAKPSVIVAGLSIAPPTLLTPCRPPHGMSSWLVPPCRTLPAACMAPVTNKKRGGLERQGHMLVTLMTCSCHDIQYSKAAQGPARRTF